MNQAILSYLLCLQRYDTDELLLIRQHQHFSSHGQLLWQGPTSTDRLEAHPLPGSPPVTSRPSLTKPQYVIPETIPPSDCVSYKQPGSWTASPNELDTAISQLDSWHGTDVRFRPKADIVINGKCVGSDYLEIRCCCIRPAPNASFGSDISAPAMPKCSTRLTANS